MKTITLLLDGAGDRSYEVLGEKTPLQYAKTPNLDKLAEKSQCGLLTPLNEGVSLGTDLAHFLLFGYELDAYPNRSIIDAVGESVQLEGRELVLRCSWAQVKKDDSGYLLESRFTAGLSDDEIKELLPNLNMEINGYTFECVHSYDSHGFIIVRTVSGNPIAPQVGKHISDADPFYVPQYVMKVEPFEMDHGTSNDSDLVSEVEDITGAINSYIKETYKVLSQTDLNKRRENAGQELANIILTKWAGVYSKPEPFNERSGMTGHLIGKSNLLSGLSAYIEMAYERYDAFEDAVQKALNSSAQYVHLHTKAPDEASHKKDPFKKVKSLEYIDGCIGPLLDHKGLLIVTADHSTPCAGQMIHSGESVPFMARGTFVRTDTVEAFDEIECSKGSLHLMGSDFMKYIQNATDQGNLYHLRTGKKRRNYRPMKVNKL